MTEHPGEQFPPDVDPDVEPGFNPDQPEVTPAHPDYDTEPDPRSTTDEAVHDAEHGTAHDAEHGTAHDAEHGTAHDAVQEAAYGGEEGERSGEHVDPAAVEFGPEFARAPGQEHEHSFEADSAEDPAYGDSAGDPAYGASAGDSAYGDSAEGSAYGEVGDEGGHPLVEETMARLDGLRERPVSEHGEVYADLHERLQTALVEADADQNDRG